LHADTDSDQRPGRHASPFGSVVTGSRELLELPDFPRDYPPSPALGADHGEGFPDMSRFALLFTEQEASCHLPDKEFRLNLTQQLSMLSG
jgi:hypothetical protein